MRRLHIDIETYSEVDLAQCGVYRYATDPHFELLLLACAFDDATVEVYDLSEGDPAMRSVRVLLEMIIAGDVEVWAHNAIFERVCLSVIARRLGLLREQEWLDPTCWRCTMVLSAMCGLPASLAQVGSVLGLTRQKMKEGVELIRMFCTPHEPKGSLGLTLRRTQAQDAPEQWAVFREYCRRDVEVERAIHEACGWYVREMGEGAYMREWELYACDQRINDHGVSVDRELTSRAREMAGDDKPALIARMRKITGLTNPASPAQLKGWLASRLGHPVGSVGKESADAIVKEARTLGADDVCEVMKLRVMTSRSSVSKYGRIGDMLCADGRLRGLLRYYGTRTGRWSSHGVQLHNLPQNHLPMLDEARRLAREGDGATLSLVYGDLQSTLVQLIRTVFVPAEGRQFVVCDFSAVEARILAWLAGEQWVLRAFEQGEDIYCVTASKMFGVPVGKHGPNAELRQKGKVAVLALGYAGGVGALARMGGERLGMTEREMKETVRLWRENNPNIVMLWGAVEGAVRRAVLTGQRQSARLMNGQPIGVSLHGETLCITLPSGRMLSYRDMQVGKGGEGLSYMGLVQGSGSWERIRTHGGELVENITQAVGRDLLADVIRRVQQAGMDIVLHVHDEIVAEVEDTAVTSRIIQDIFASGPAWAEGLPLKGASYTGSYYYKD